MLPLPLKMQHLRLSSFIISKMGKAICFMGLPWWLRGYTICLQCGRPRFNPWVGKIPWRKNGNAFQYSCLENIMDGEAWYATVHGVAKSQIGLSDFTFTFSGSHSKESTSNVGDLGSIPGLGRSPRERNDYPSPVFLPGESPWTEEPGGLQSMGSQRVGYD